MAGYRLLNPPPGLRMSAGAVLNSLGADSSGRCGRIISVAKRRPKDCAQPALDD